MPKVTKIIQSLNGGELSPLMDFRIDQAKYQSGCRTVENFIPLIYGGVERRPGTKYVATAKDTTAVRMVDFVYSVDDAYALEFGNQYIRFYKDGAQITSGGSPYEIATPYLTADLFDLQFEHSADVTYITHPDYEPRKLQRTASTPTFTLTALSFEDGPFLNMNEDNTDTITVSEIAAGGIATGASVTLTAVGCTPFVTGTTAGHSPSGSAATSKSTTGALFKIVHSLGKADGTSNVNKSFTSATSSDSLLVYKGIHWYFVTNGTWTGQITLQRSYDNSVWEIVHTVSSQNNDNNKTDMIEKNGDAYYKMVSTKGAYAAWSGTADCQFFVSDLSHTGIVKITAVASTTSATATVLATISSTDATHRWAEGAWSNYRGWPISVAISPEERLTFAGSTSYPLNVWGSVSGDYTSMKEGTLDDDAIIFSLVGAGQQNQVRWILSKNALIIGTYGGEHVLGGANEDEALTPTNVHAEMQSSYGSSSVAGLMINNAIVFLQRGGRKLREMIYAYTEQAYVSDDLTTFSNHITESGITNMAYQRSPDPILWCIRTDGQIAIMGYEKKQDFDSWARFVTYTSNGTVESDFESACIIPTSGEEDQIWVSVERKIGASTYRYIEYFSTRAFTAQNDAYFVDCGITYDGVSTTTITGLGHLEGETVQVQGNGANLGTYTVSGGAITLTSAVTSAKIGLYYPTSVKPTKLDIGGLGISTTKKISKAIISFYRTLGGRCGSDSSNMETITFRTGADHLGSPPSLFTGIKEISFPGGYEREGNIIIEQKEPLPMTVLGIALDLGVENE